MKAYVLFFDLSAIEHSRVRDFIDDQENIVNWYSPFPGFFILISDEDAQALGQIMLKLTKEKGRFIIAEPSSYHGWLPKAAWRMLRERTAAEK